MLPLRNQEALTSFLGRLQDRTSSDYRKFLSVQQFTDQFSPAASDYQAAVAWAQSKGFQVGEQPANRLVIPIVGTVSQINQAFNVQLASYQHPTENRTFFAPDREPTVDLTVPLWHIAGLDNYSVPHPLYVMGSVAHGNTGSGPGGAFLGSDRRAAYYGSTTLTGAGQSVGIFELDGYSISDVQAYFTNVGQPLSAPINNVLIDGASGASDGIDDSEQVIDIIEAASMAPGLSQILVYIGPRSTFNPGTTDVDIFNRMASDNIAKQISVSWAWEPADPSYLDPIFQQFMAQGQTVFAASGDNSAWVSGDYYEGLPEIYPAEDPNVTAVGGTVLTTSGAGGPRASEIAWGDANNTCQANYLDPYPGSGGGTSLDNIPIPQYQQLGGVINSSNLGSTTLRNAPDVAAEANCDNYYCANGGCGQGIGGTSLAAPTWAGFTALVNQQVVANGNTPLGGLGSINPLLYSIGVGPDYNRDLYDITIGDNITPASNNLSPAVPGYDLVTGWGSPNGQSLIQDLQPLPIAGTLTNAATKQIVKFNDCTNTIFDYTWTFTDQAGAHGFTGTSSFITRSGGRDCAPGSEYVPLDEWSADGLYYLEATGGTGSIVLHE
jgi:subtilase family serine protease